MKTLLLLIELTLVGSMLPLCEATESENSDAVNSALIVLTGNDSRIQHSSYEKVRSVAEWKKTWLSHLGLKEDTIYRTSMEVDFSRCMVIAVFGGKYVNSCGYRIESVHEDKHSTIVRFDDVSYQTAGPNGGADQVTPYAFIVLPKSEKPVVLEKNMQRYKGESPEWKKVARLN
jgi:hypothetical protein